MGLLIFKQFQFLVETGVIGYISPVPWQQKSDKSKLKNIMNAIQDIYYISTGLGFIYIIASSLMGSFHSHGGSGHGGTHGGGHAGAGHASAGHAASSSGHSGAHAGHGAGSHAAGHGVASHGIAHGGGARGPGHSSAHHSSTNAAQQGNGSNNEVQNLLSQSTTIVQKKTEVPALYLKILDVLSPTKWSFFLFTFGAIGIISMRFLPAALSLLPATIGAWVLANLFFGIMSTVLSKMNSSTNFRKEQLIGSLGELTLSIEEGGMGEVLINTGNSRLSNAAKAFKPGTTIKKLTKVIIVDYKDSIFYVEPFDDQNFTVDADSFKELDK
ncbi:MAG: hypothetical protein K2X81_06335 [Candidatus Obscuribacterales bacterium]|nr:hypothetical protein [Candidatus Obscuribacterales bacterium]